MVEMIQWKRGRYNQETLRLTVELKLTVDLSMVSKDECQRYTASLFGLTLKKKFETSDAAKEAVELKARQLLKSGLENLEEKMNNE